MTKDSGIFLNGYSKKNSLIFFVNGKKVRNNYTYSSISQLIFDKAFVQWTL